MFPKTKNSRKIAKKEKFCNKVFKKLSKMVDICIFCTVILQNASLNQKISETFHYFWLKGLFICIPKHHFVPRVLARCQNSLPKVLAWNDISARRCMDPDCQKSWIHLVYSRNFSISQVRGKKSNFFLLEMSWNIK